jgi:oligopeptidase A
MTTSSTLIPPQLQNNALLSFGRGIAVYSQVKPEQIAPAIEYLLKCAQDAVDQATDPNTASSWDKLVEPLEDATEALGRSWGVISHLNSVADTQN